MNGAQSAAENGQPKTAPAANQYSPCAVLTPPCQIMNADAPAMAVYMAKLDGRKAVLAWKLPGLVASATAKRTPTRGVRTRETARKKSVCERAQIKARTYRTK